MSTEFFAVHYQRQVPSAQYIMVFVNRQHAEECCRFIRDLDEMPRSTIGRPYDLFSVDPLNNPTHIIPYGAHRPIVFNAVQNPDFLEDDPDDPDESLSYQLEYVTLT